MNKPLQAARQICCAAWWINVHDGDASQDNVYVSV